MRRAIVFLALACALGCSPLAYLTGKRESPGRTLADIAPAVITEEAGSPPRVSLAELADIYEGVLQVSTDPQTRLSVSHRLADLKMLASEERLVLAQPTPQLFVEVIDSYEQLLAQHPENPGNDQLLYQLSKAYDLGGENDKSLGALRRLRASYPDSPHLAEAHFRMAEHYFANANYPQAERAYATVIEFGRDRPYYRQAQYMHGWSRFKQGGFRASIASFTATLDQLIPQDNKLTGLSRGERELLTDCLRVLAVVFGSLEGPQTIVAAYDALGVRPYQHMLYEALGERYLAQERYRDSAETYKAFTRRFPDSPLAHRFALRVIESYEAGGFPDLIVTGKQHYVDAFGVTGSYWLASTEEAQVAMTGTLKLYIDELARYYHALAQESAKKSGLAIALYGQASRYYQLYIDSFPEDPKTPDMGFLLAESSFAAGDYRESIRAYEWVAYGFPGYRRAADAAYSAIVAYDRLGTADSKTGRARIDSELRFASSFHDDSRAPMLLSHAASALLDSGEYQLAIISAATLLAGDTSSDLALSAQLVLAHSHFELRQYPGAEQAYLGALALMARGDKRRNGTLEQVAASIYRQGEEAAARQDYRAAATQFARVQAAAPGSIIRIAAQYDAANNFMLDEDYTEANRLLLDFRRRYPKNELAASIPALLVDNYVKLEDWAAAARELDGIHGRAMTDDRKGRALYLAAQYYDRAGDAARAIERYRSYAHGWTEPLDIRFEAMNRLAELYAERNEGDKRRFWLKKMVAAHDAADAGGSPRSLFLAAMSASVLAGDRFEAFRSVGLRLPLKKSIRRKKSAMEKALAAHQKTNQYGVTQFSTLATHRMGQIYRHMSTDLLASQRPGNLDALALEQYELLLEEQAYPFEEKAIAIWETNARRSWEGLYDEWVQASFTALAELQPARYSKTEAITDSNLELAVYNERGIALRERGEFADAEQAYLAALERSEAHPDSHRNLGILYDLYMGRPGRALQHFNRYQHLTGSGDRAVAGWIADLERRATLLVRGN